MDFVDTYEIRIEVDEGRFYHLHVRGMLANGESKDFDFPMGENVAEELYEAVKREIGPWLYERDQARAEFRCSPDESGGVADVLDGISEAAARAAAAAYELSDPKHPDWHSVHADIYDNREKV